MQKRFKASIIGGAGYGSAEIIRRLLIHPDVELVRVSEIQNVGELLSAAHPKLEGRTELRFEALSPEDAAKGVDVVFLGLPHKVSASVVPKIIDSGAKIIDLSGDFRLKDVAAYERYYGGTHPALGSSRARCTACRSSSREAITRRDARRLARHLRDDHRARTPAAREGGPARRRGRDPRSASPGSSGSAAPQPRARYHPCAP